MQTLRHLAGRSSLVGLLRHGLFLLGVFGPLAFLLSQQPIGQDTNYHDFADKRAFFGITNFLDVVFNVLFVLVGLAGMNACLASGSTGKGPAWLTFFAGVTLLGAGSAYYHWSPNGETLVWDRLPMALASMGLFVALVTEYASPRVGTLLLVPAILVGLASVMYWSRYDDLRLYYWIQSLPLLTIPVVMALYRARYTRQGYLLIALALYLLAKLSESHDGEILTVTLGLVSGHALKHILAALAIYTVLMMLKTRTLNRGAAPQ